MDQRTKKISITDRTFYKLGFLDGTAEAQKTINVMQTTNGALYKELVRLDQYHPTTGVLLDKDTASRMLNLLQKQNTAKKLIDILETAIENHLKDKIVISS